MTNTELTQVKETINTATLYAERAETLLDDAIMPLFEAIEPSKEMLQTMQYQYQSICCYLFTITDYLARAVAHLHALVESDGGRVKYIIEQAEGLQAVIDIVKKNCMSETS